MLKPSFYLLPMLLASGSALALSCASENDTGCISLAQSAKDCSDLGYSLVDKNVNDKGNDLNGCHYLSCPFNTNYKVCIDDSCGKCDDPEPVTCPEGQQTAEQCAAQNLVLISGTGYKNGCGICTCPNGTMTEDMCSFQNGKFVPDLIAQNGCGTCEYDCATMQERLEDASGRTYLYSCMGLNYCPIGCPSNIKNTQKPGGGRYSGEEYGSFQDPCLLGLIRDKELEKFEGTDSSDGSCRLSQEFLCTEVVRALGEVIVEHNKKCPDNQFKGNFSINCYMYWGMGETTPEEPIPQYGLYGCREEEILR